MSKIIFTVTPGRSGTAYLARVLDRVTGLVARHEPEPNFKNVLHDLPNNRTLAYRFMRDVKWPAIRALAGDCAYLETSHLFGAGFFYAWVSVIMRPDIIVLRRDKYAIADSMYELDQIPGRTMPDYLISPDTARFCRVDGWQKLHDWQLCFWYVLEMEVRQTTYAYTAAMCGGTVYDVDLDDLQTVDDFDRLVQTFGLPALSPDDRQNVAAIAGQPVNQKRNARAKINRAAPGAEQRGDLVADLMRRLRPV